MKNLFRLSVFLFAGLFCLVSFSYADVPSTISFQGRLTDNTGAPITDTKTFKFEILDGGTVWTETHTGVDVRNGLYSVTLGKNTALTGVDFNKPALKLKVTVDTLSITSDLTASPFALSVRDSSITETKIANNAVTGAKLETITTAVSRGETANKTLVSGGTFKVVQTTVDNKGRVTGLNERTMTMPSGLAPTGTAGGDLSGNYPNPDLKSIITATTQGESNNKTLVSGGSFQVLQAAVDAKGRVTGLNARTMTMPSGLAPTGTAGGDLSGSYPNPDLKSIITAATKGEANNKTLTSGGTFTVLQATVDAKGRVTALDEKTMTMPTIPSTTGFEQTSNKEVSALTNSSTTYPASSVVYSTVSAIYSSLGSKLDSNTPISAGTYAKVTVDAKGLVTGGTGLLESDIPALSTYVNTNSAQNISGVKTFQDNMIIDTGKTLTIGGASLEYGNIAGTIGANGLIVNSNANIKGNFNVTGTTYNESGADLAEIYPASDMLEPGDVVIISEARDGYIEKSKSANDTKVAGVISTEPGIVLNAGEKGYKLALVGKVPVKVTNEGGNIKRGDLLVASSTPGHAMKATDPKTGTVIGKAMENSTGTRGKILALVNLQ